MDEHVPLAVTEGLRRRGSDVVTTQEAGLLGTNDAQQLEYATRQGRVMFTQDDDFLRLHANGVTHAGIVYAPQGTSIGALVHGLVEISTLLDAAEMVQHVEFL